MNDTAVQFISACAGYHRHVLVGSLSLEIRKGEILTLIGPNGAGKSTVLKTLTRQLEMVGGRISVCGFNLADMSSSDVAGHMSVLLTEKVKDGYLTAFDVASMGRYPYTGRLGILSEEDRRKTHDALIRVEAENLSDRLFSELSDGQKQRILLARALAQEPDILVLDEPTAYLDIRYQMKLMDLLTSLSRRDGVTIILSLHEIDLALKISDRILAIKDDHTWFSGTPEELSSAGRLEELFLIEKGRYDPLTGSFELKRAGGVPEIFVISSGGSGIPVYRRLVRKNLPFAAGILFENDMDFHFACQMASSVISEKPFRSISDETYRKALSVMRGCSRVIDAGITIGPQNQKMADLLKEAESSAKSIQRIHGSVR